MAEVNRREIYRYLGIKGQQEPDLQTKDLVEDCLEELERSVNCRSFYRRYPLTLLPDSELDFTCFKVKSRALSRNLKDCQEVILFAATLGAGVDLLLRRYSRLSMSRAVVLQACAAARIESYCNEINDKLKAEAAEEGLYLRPRFSPGYGDLAAFVPAGFLPGTGSGKDGGDYIDGKFFNDAVQVGDGGHRSIEDSGGLCERGL